MSEDPVPTVERISLTRRLSAIAAVVCGTGALAMLVFLLISTWWLAVIGVGSLALATSAFVRFVVRHKGHRGRWAIIGGVGVIGLIGSIIAVGVVRPWPTAALVVLLAAGSALARYAERGYVRPIAAPPVEGTVRDVSSRRSVLFLNPKSGGGKVGAFDLVAEAQRRGVETVVLEAEDDLTALAERAVAEGATVLGMAGGDGSQADVAAVAVAHDLPFVCIPAGTRNHFAFDLNLDRSDPRPALDAFVEGVERKVDHGLVNDVFFVNNVSLGIYPYIVQDPSYRDGRIKAATTIIPELMREDSPTIDLRFESPSGTCYTTAQVLLVSNNPYRGFGGLDGAGRRVSLTGGELGVLVVAADDADQLARSTQKVTLGASVEKVEGFDQWTAPSVHVESSDDHVLAGVDGESMELGAPLDIRIVPAGLRVLVPIGTPDDPEVTPGLLSLEAVTNLLDIAGGAAPGPFGDDD